MRRVRGGRGIEEGGETKRIGECRQGKKING